MKTRFIATRHAHNIEQRGAWRIAAARRLLMVFIPLILSGCVGVLPVPASGKQTLSGQIIERQDIQFIVPGRTTRSEVMAKLGSNYRSTPNKSAIAYSWVRKGGDIYWYSSLFIPSDMGTIAGGDAGKTTNAWSYWRAFFVAFDPEDRVAHIKLVHLSSRTSLDLQLEKWTASVRPQKAPAGSHAQPPLKH